MADTLTIELDPETAEQLRRAAAAEGESVEALARRLLARATYEMGAGEEDAAESLLTPEQLADLEQRLKNPGPYATDEEVEAFFARSRR